MLRSFLAYGVACLLVSIPAAAQSSAGEITGQVTDMTGAGVAGAKVAIRNTGTGESRQLETDASGNYLATQLVPGRMSLGSRRKGFGDSSAPA